MGVAETVAATIAKVVLEKLTSGGSEARTAPMKLERAIAEHLNEVANWTEKVHTFSAAVPSETDQSTIEIGFDSETRRFSVPGISEPKHEQDLLETPAHYLILGNPGSGKTTAIKRIARRLLFDEPKSGEDCFQYPLVIRLRELKRGESLHCAIATALGISYEVRTVTHKTPAGIEESREVIHVEGEPVEKVIARVVTATRPLVLLDGLDEVPLDERRGIAVEIGRLANAVDLAKILVTSRTGETNTFEGFETLQLCPLTTEQVSEIACRWLSQPSDFMDALEHLPYRDIADRPLLLTQLLLLFRRYGFLPEQPAQVYKRVIRLLLEEWDAQRHIVRKSRYAEFDTDRKSEFLAAMAFQLTYVAAKSNFSEGELIEAYDRVRDVFNLPSNEGKQVARELEAHTGIFIELAEGRFEFSHLSIQEYLCANFVIRSASPSLIRRAIGENPAPIAVAVALSSQPSEWLARLVLTSQNQAWLERSGVQQFVSRLLVERPYFEEFEPLGWAALHVGTRLYFSAGVVPDVAVAFTRSPGVRRSIVASLRHYFVDGELADGALFSLRRKDDFVGIEDLEAPMSLVISRQTLDSVATDKPDSAIWARKGVGLRRMELHTFLSKRHRDDY